MLGLGIPQVYSIIQEMKLEVGLIGGFYDIQHCQPILQAVIILVAMVGKKTLLALRVTEKVFN